MPMRKAPATVLISVLLALGTEACGSGSKVSAAKVSATATTATAATTATSASQTVAPSHASHGRTGGPSVQPLPGPVVSGSAGGMRATLHGDNHAPTVNKHWHYSVLATDASGHPLSGTVDTEFALGGQVVGHETPPTHRLSSGRLNDAVTFPAQAVGVPLALQVVVHTHLGSVTLSWPVKVQR
jgi:hypothetical protein